MVAIIKVCMTIHVQMMCQFIANTYIDYVQLLKKVKSNCVHLGNNVSCDVHDN